MPPEDWTSITVTKSFFDRFDAVYKYHKLHGTLNPGIVSFSSFFAEQLELAIKQKNSMRDFVNIIKYVPAKFTETKLVIKVN